MTAKPEKQGTDLLYSLIAQARQYPDVIILGRGDPDFDTPPSIVAAAGAAMHAHANDYSPPEGILALRQAIADRVKRVNNIDVDPEHEVVVTNGGQEALFLMVLATAGHGDEIIVPDPNYNTYNDALRFVGANPVTISTSPSTNFRVDPAHVRSAITDRTRAILLVSPNNPAASVTPPADVEEFVRIAQEHDLWLLSDEIYDLFVYDDVRHVSPAALPGGKERTLTLQALSKTYSMTGWRLGWLTGPADLMAQVKELKAAISGPNSIISQYAGLEALTGSQVPVAEMHAAYKRRRRVVLDALDSMDISYGTPQGGQFVFADISSTGMGSIELARRILEEEHVLAYPGAAFGPDWDHCVRVTFLQPDEKLQEGLDRMKRAMQKIMANRGARNVMNDTDGSYVRRGLIPEDLLKFRWVDEIVLAPDGRHLAYSVKQPDAASNGYVAHVYVRNLEQNRTGRLTSGSGRAVALAWSRDGARLAFNWTEGAANAVQVVTIDHEVPDLGGAKAAQYGMPDAAMTGLDWSADGTRLVGVRWTPMRRQDDRGPQPGIPAPTIRVVRRLRYKMDGPGWVLDRFLQIWVLDLATGELAQVTDSEADYSEPRWSGAGSRLAFVGVAREQDREVGQGQIFVCDYPDGPPRRLLPDWVGACRSPAWGDQDRHIAFAGHDKPAPVNRRHFMQPYVAEVAAGTARPLAPDIDEEVGNYAVADQRAGLANITVRWPHSDRWIYFLLTEQGGVNLYRIDLEGRRERLVAGPSVVFEYSAVAGDRAAYGLANPGNPGDVHLWDQGRSVRLTDLNAWLRDHTLAAPEEYWYDGLDGARVHAWLLTPPVFDPGLVYPTIVYVHCSMFSWDFSHEFQCLANAGFVVAYFNQRGTTAGYGQAWTRASEGDQGGRDYEEIMLGVDELLARPYIDRNRLGVTGGSCGGFMTNWIVGHTDRFRAAVTQRSISNQVSFFGTSDIGPEGTIAETGASPWSNLEAVWRQSPIAYAERIHTPLLILHSTEDHRCPLEQAEQLFAILRWLGREVEMVIFEGESHGLSRGGRPGNRVERLRRIQGWFERHLGTQPHGA